MKKCNISIESLVLIAKYKFQMIAELQYNVIARHNLACNKKMGRTKKKKKKKKKNTSFALHGNIL